MCMRLRSAATSKSTIHWMTAVLVRGSSTPVNARGVGPDDDLVAQLERAGFVNRGGRGSHRNFVHPRLAKATARSTNTSATGAPERPDFEMFPDPLPGPLPRERENTVSQRRGRTSVDVHEPQIQNVIRPQQRLDVLPHRSRDVPVN